MVIIGDSGQNYTLAMSVSWNEISTKIMRRLLQYTDMHLPILPFQDVAVHFEADAFWLNDM